MTKDEVATRAECWMCSYCPVLASGKRGPATEGMLTVQIGTPNLTLHTHPRGEPLARHPKPARPIDHGFYVEMGDYVVQALRPASDIDGGQNPAFDAAFLYPGQVLPPHLTRNMQQHAHARQHEEEDEWDALLSWFGLGGGGDDERDALPAPKRAGFPPIPNPGETTYHAHPSVRPEHVYYPPADARVRAEDSAGSPTTAASPPAASPPAASKAKDPPPPPPRVDPFARLPPTYSGPGTARSAVESGQIERRPPASRGVRSDELGDGGCAGR